MNDWIIQTKHLTRDFKTARNPNGSTGGANGTIRAVDHLDLEIPPGIVFGFLGPNGSGKTTTIRLLLGLLEPTQGQAEVFGFDTRTQASAIRERTGALLEHTGLYERLSAEDNLDFYGRVARLPAHQRRARIQELFEHFGLWERRKETAGGWSRGMKQKLAVARALIHSPRLIFLDEPTAGLDPLAAAALRDDLARLASDHRVTVFLTTHNLTEAEKLCEQVAVIRSGRLLAVGAPDQLRGQHSSTQVEIVGRGFTPELVAQIRARSEITGVRLEDGRLVLEPRQGAELAPIITQLVLGGAQIEEICKNKASLEEIFLDLVEDETKEAA
jgi:ABC-2 type transport system ATP-binding protein